MRKDEAAPHRVTVASNEVAASNANKKHMRQQTSHRPKSMPEGALGPALSEALRRKLFFLPASTVNSIRLAYIRESGDACPMGDLLKLISWEVIRAAPIKSFARGGDPKLHHQLTVLRRKSPKRLAFSKFDRLVLPALIGLRRAL